MTQKSRPVFAQPQRVIKALEKTIWINGKPKRIRTDNGPEFISKELEAGVRPMVLSMYSHSQNVLHRTHTSSALMVAIGVESWMLTSSEHYRTFAISPKDGNLTTIRHVLTKLWETRHQWSTMK